MEQTIKRVNKSLIARIFILLLFLASCGLQDDYQYIDPVDVSQRYITGVDNVTFTTPDNSQFKLVFNDSSSFPYITSLTNSSITDFFNNYDLYYRIYASDKFVNAQTDYTNINKTLTTDESNLYTYTVVSNNKTWLVTTAATYHYFKMSNDGQTLLRSSDLITPYPTTYPEYYFLYDPDLVNSAYVYSTTNTTNNADVAANNPSGTPTYAYVSIYVVHTGYDPTSLSTLYSSPTWLGVFLLPNSTNKQPIDINSVTADGDTSTPTTKLTINVGKDIDLTSADYISISPNLPAGVTKGDLSHLGNGIYELDLNQTVTGEITSADITVSINTGNYISSGYGPVTIHYYQ